MSDPGPLDQGALERIHRIGGAELVREMIRLFVENGGRRLEDARRGQEAGDIQAVREALHALISSAGTIGAPRLRRLAEESRRPDLGEDRDELAALLDRVEAAYGEVKRLLLEEQERLAGDAGDKESTGGASR
jgi:HPt (histidine-containing phosphotransfer) domain-containing protein